MKTAEEWLQFHAELSLVNLVKKIQLDAWKQGMSDASNLLIPKYPRDIQGAQREADFDRGCADTQRYIKCARDSKKEL